MKRDTRRPAMPLGLISQKELLNHAAAACTAKNLKRRRAYLECERRDPGACDSVWAPHIDKQTCGLSLRKRRKKTAIRRKR